MPSFTAFPIPAEPLRSATAVQLVFSGVEQAGPSFEGRVYLNRPKVDEATPQTPENGYVGSFHVYGYGRASPPALSEAFAQKNADSGAVAPIEKRLRVSGETIREMIGRSDELVVTVVTWPAAADERAPTVPFESVSAVAVS
jgi:hypothetical protein